MGVGKFQLVVLGVLVASFALSSAGPLERPLDHEPRITSHEPRASDAQTRVRIDADRQVHIERLEQQHMADTVGYQHLVHSLVDQQRSLTIPGVVRTPTRLWKAIREKEMVDATIKLAGQKGSGILKLRDHVIYKENGNLAIIDARARERLALDHKKTNERVLSLLNEHVTGTHAGAGYVSVHVPEGTHDLVFLRNDKQIAIAPDTSAAEASSAIARMLVAETEPNSDVIFTMHPDLDGAARDRLDSVLFHLDSRVSGVDGRQLYRDDYDDRTTERARTIRGLSSTASTVAMVADPSFGIEDGKVIQNIDEELEKVGIRVVHVGADGAVTTPDESVVIVITGHSAKELKAFVRGLEHHGAFEGKTVILNSCGTPLTRDLASSIVTSGGANGVLRFEGTITSTQVRTFMREIMRVRKDDPSSLPKLFQKGIRAAGMRAQLQISLLEGKN